MFSSSIQSNLDAISKFLYIHPLTTSAKHLIKCLFCSDYSHALLVSTAQTKVNYQKNVLWVTTQTQLVASSATYAQRDTDVK